jgi:hypothetical protein
MGVVLFATPEIDLTDQVLQELNKDTIAPGETASEEQPKLPELNDPLADDFKDNFMDGLEEDTKPQDLKP